MKKLETLRKIMAIITISSLIDVPFIIAKEKSEDSEDAEDKFIKNAEVIGTGAAQMYGQYIQQQVEAAQLMSNAVILNKLGPGCTQNGVPCHITPAKYFPECPITNSMVNFPKGMCEAPSMMPNQISMMKSYKDLANNWVNQFDHMMNTAQNSNYPIGLKCLADKQAALNQQLQNTENSLTALQTQLKKDLQVFKENNKKILEELDKNNKELFGLDGGSKVTNDDKLRNLRNFFSPSCQNVIGKENFVSQPGLNGILKSVSLTNSDASNYLSNRNAIEADIKRALEKVNNKIRNEGVVAIETGTIDVELKNLNPATLQVLNKMREEYRLNKTRIESQIRDVQPDYKLPVADNNFTEDSAEFISTAQTQFKKQYINECVTGEDKGVAIPLTEVLNSLQQKSTGSKGNARDKYRAALEAIVRSNESVDQKLQRIKELESVYSDITITYQNQQALRVTKTPYQLYMDIAKACEQRYTTTQTENGNTGTSNSSQKKKVDRAVNLIKEFKNLNDTFTAKLNQAVNEQVLNCSGAAKKSEDGGCAKSLDRNNENFCIAHANQCATEIQACHTEATNQVKVREQKMNTLANTFNANMTALIARSNQLYEAQKGQVQNLVGYMQQRFPGTQFELPKDMFVPTPELAKSDFGVNLMGGNQINLKGELKFLEDQNSLIGKIDKFKEMIKSQRESTNELLKNYIDNQSTAMNEQRSKWEELGKRCNDVYLASKDQVNQYNQKGLEAQGKAQNAAGQFCKRFKAWSKNPNPGCSKSLFSALEALSKSDGAANYTNDGALEAAATMKDLCDENQSEIAAAKKAADKNKIPFVTVCGSAPYSDKTFVDNLKKEIGDFKTDEFEKPVASTVTAPSQEAITDAENKVKGLRAELEKLPEAQRKDSPLNQKIVDAQKELDTLNQKKAEAEKPAKLAVDYFASVLKDESKYKKLAEGLNEKQKEFIEQLKLVTSTNSTNGNVCDVVSANLKEKFTESKGADLIDKLNAARSTAGDKSEIAMQLKAIGEDAKEITCEAGSNGGRNIFKDLLSAPAALQNLGIGGIAQ